MWSSGKQLSASSYSSWDPSMPAMHAGLDCVKLSNGTLWNWVVHTCSVQYPYICQEGKNRMFN